MKYLIWVALLACVLLPSGCARQQACCGGKCGINCAGRQGCSVKEECKGKRCSISARSCSSRCGQRSCNSAGNKTDMLEKGDCCKTIAEPNAPGTRCAGKCRDGKERKNLITFKGKPLTLLGRTPGIGDKASDFLLVRNDLTEATLSDFAGKNILLSVVPSLDTGVCDLQTKRFNEEAALLKETIVLTVSMDLPFAQARWCGAAKAEHITTLSAHRSKLFGMTYGLYIKELGLLARSVMLIGKDGRLKYIELVPEVASHPDYERIFKLLKSLEEQ